MSLLVSIKNALRTIGDDIRTLYLTLTQAKEIADDLLQFELKSKDAFDVWTITEHYRDDNTLYRKSVLSGGTAPNYTTMTVTLYSDDGQTVEDERVYTLTYSNGVLVKRELVTSP